MNDNPYQPPSPQQYLQPTVGSMPRSEMLELKKVGVLSVGKVLAITYAILGLIFGGFLSLLTLAGAAIGGAEQAGPAIFVNLGAIFVLPVVYGAMGFVGGIIMAALYNLIATFAGGVEMELKPRDGRIVA